MGLCVVSPTSAKFSWQKHGLWQGKQAWAVLLKAAKVQLSSREEQFYRYPSQIRPHLLGKWFFFFSGPGVGVVPHHWAASWEGRGCTGEPCSDVSFISACFTQWGARRKWLEWMKNCYFAWVVSVLFLMVTRNHSQRLGKTLLFKFSD